ncbi:MAG: PAS domain S-box protein [Rubrobacteraceae bacterium]
MKPDPGEGEPSRARLRVLIVEDSPDDALLLALELEKGGFEPDCERVETPAEMREALDGPEWDVVLADWRMPRFSGPDALAILRESDVDAPFIIVSGEVGEETAVGAMRAGATDYVMKDNLARLCATVERSLEEAEARRERGRAEESLQESEERYRRLVEFSPDSIIVHDGERVLFVNAAGVELFGADCVEDLVGEPVMDFIHPEYRETVKARIARTREKGERADLIQEKFLRLDGRAVDVEVVSMPIAYDEGGAATLVVARDVTSRKRAEEERDRLFEVSLDLLGVAGSDGYFKRVNPAFEETLGYSREELLAKPFVEFVHPEDRAATVRELEGLGRGERTAYFENRYLREDGAEVWLEWKAVPVIEEDLIYATARDVTERKRAEEALRRRDAILRAVAFAAERFLERAASWEESAHEVLARLGVAAGASRVYIFESLSNADGLVLPTKKYEWLAPGIGAGADNPTRTDLPHRTTDYARWGEILGRGEPLRGHTRDFPEEEQTLLRADGVLSIALVSVFVGEEWWGFIGLDECEKERDWSGAEIEALEAAADTLGAAIQRGRAEEEIRQSEQLYRTVVEQATEYISLVDAETMRFVGSNPAFRDALGYSEEELRSMTLYDVVAHDRGSIDENARLVLDRGRHSLGERRHRRKDGSLIDVEVSASVVVHNGREVACIVGHDVTERRRNEEDLRASEERFRATFEQAAVGVAHVSPHGSWLRVNEKLCGILGHTREELLELSFQDITHPDDLEADLEYHERLLSGEIPGYSMEKRYVRKDGSLVWIQLTTSLGRDPSGEPKYFIAIVEDITERKRDRDALAQSEERYRAVVEQAAEGIFLFDAATGRILESNAAFGELLGYSEEELRSMALYDVVAHDRESVDANVRLVRDEGNRFVGERRYRRKDGSLVDVEVTASLVSYGGREVICVVIRDVTERLEAFRMLEERVTSLAGISASLTVDQTMEATLDALAAGVVHSTAALACSVVLMDSETGVFLLAGSHGLPEGYTDAMRASWRGGVQTPTLRVFRSRRPLLVQSARRVLLDDPLYAPLHPFVRQARWDVGYIVPLVARGEVLGAINLYYLPEQEPGEDETVFLSAVADQAAVAVENAQLFAAAQGKAALEERQRLARELHDSVSQALYGIGLGARTARTLLGREAEPERVDEWLEYVLSLAEAGLTEMRSLIFELRPESLESEGLVVALEKQAVAVEARYEIPVRMALGEEPSLPLEAKEALYRIAQEALHNTVKHARAGKVDLRLECGETGIALEVSDDGAGFDTAAPFSGRLGLKSMRERAERLGGTLRVESHPGEGAVIRVRIPSGAAPER